MRVFFCIVGFLIFGLLLFVLLGDALVNEDWLDSLGNWKWVVVVGLIISDILIPIPTTLLITKMGQQYGPFLGGLIGLLGMFLAAVCAYGLTRLLGIRFARFLLGKDLESAERFFDRNGMFAVACSRWLPLLPETISCMAGLTRMPFGKYCLAVLCGAVPMCFAYSMLAWIPGDEIIPLLISILLPVPIWWIAGRLLYRRTRPADESPQK